LGKKKIVVVIFKKSSPSGGEKSRATLGLSMPLMLRNAF
jgi:hypothetical protein